MEPTVLILDSLGQILEALTTPEASGGCPLDLQPCRVSLYPGGAVAFDSCESGECGDGSEGQLWANLQPFTVVGDRTCRTIRFTAEIGITRCAPKPTDSQPIPSVDDVAAAAWQQGIDADQILNALICCEFGDPNSGRDKLEVTGWRPIDEQGGCVGGIWSVSGVLEVCC